VTNIALKNEVEIETIILIHFIIRINVEVTGISTVYLPKIDIPNGGRGHSVSKSS
jgi:hypothetical protein